MKCRALNKRFYARQRDFICCRINGKLKSKEEYLIPACKSAIKNVAVKLRNDISNYITFVFVIILWIMIFQKCSFIRIFSLISWNKTVNLECLFIKMNWRWIQCKSNIKLLQHEMSIQLLQKRRLHKNPKNVTIGNGNHSSFYFHPRGPSRLIPN